MEMQLVQNCTRNNRGLFLMTFHTGELILSMFQPNCAKLLANWPKPTSDALVMDSQNLFWPLPRQTNPSFPVVAWKWMSSSIHDTSRGDDSGLCSLLNQVNQHCKSRTCIGDGIRYLMLSTTWLVFSMGYSGSCLLAASGSALGWRCILPCLTDWWPTLTKCSRVSVKHVSYCSRSFCAWACSSPTVCGNLQRASAAMASARVLPPQM